MNNENIRLLEKIVAPILDRKKQLNSLKEEDIRNSVECMKNIVEIQANEKLTFKEVEKAIKNLESRYKITMDTGVMLKEDNYKKWR